MVTLDPEVQLVIDGIRRAKTPALSSCAIDAARAVYAKGLRVLDIAPCAHVAWQDRELDVGGASVPARVYRPAGDAAFAGPVLVWFHGGGYCVGSIETADPVCRMFCADAACTVVSVGYRLAPEHPFPAAVDDAFGAYAAVLQELRNDGGRIALGGESAGATLALVCALLARERGLAPPTAQLLVYPTTLGRRESASKARFRDGLFLTLQDLQWFYDRYCAGRDLDDDFRFAPIAATRFDALPCTLLAVAECDPLHDDAIALAAALSQAGNRLHLKEYTGMTHGFFHMGGFVARTRAAHRDAVEFLAQAWRERAP